MIYEIRMIVDGRCEGAARFDTKPELVKLVLSMVEVVPESEVVTELGSREIVVP